MKFFSAVTFVTLFSATASGFLTPQVKPRSCDTKLNGLFDFEAFHGGGSAGQKELDDQWEAKQEILRRRRGGGGVNKDHLKKKYAHRSVEEPTTKVSKAKSIKVEKVTEDSTPSRPKFFWEQ